jgi:hypothetical protein
MHVTSVPQYNIAMQVSCKSFDLSDLVFNNLESAVVNTCFCHHRSYVSATTDRMFLSPQTVCFCHHRPYVSVTTDRMFLSPQTVCFCHHRPYVSATTDRMFLPPQTVCFCHHRPYVSATTDRMFLSPQTVCFSRLVITQPILFCLLMFLTQQRETYVLRSVFHYK